MAGTAKAFNLPFEYVLYDMSYANMILYGASLPSYKSPKGKDGNKAVEDEVINGDDPEKQAEIDKLFDESNRH